MNETKKRNLLITVIVIVFATIIFIRGAVEVYDIQKSSDLAYCINQNVLKTTKNLGRSLNKIENDKIATGCAA